MPTLHADIFTTSSSQERHTNSYDTVFREGDFLAVPWWLPVPGFLLYPALGLLMQKLVGALTPDQGTLAPMHLLFGELEGNGRYYGSDAKRSPLDRYRKPGSPPFEGP